MTDGSQSFIPMLSIPSHMIPLGKAEETEVKTAWSGSWVIGLKAQVKQKLGQPEEHNRSTLKYNNCYGFYCFCHHC